MFVNRMPRYEILSEDAVATLDGGWRRIVSELGIEFLLPEAVELFAQAGQEVDGDSRSSSTRTSCSSRSPRRRASSTCRRGTRSTSSTSAATTCRSRRCTGRRSSARARCAATRRWRTSRTSCKLSQTFPQLDSAGGTICRARGHARSTRAISTWSRAADPDRQALHGLGHLGREREGHDRAWARSSSAAARRSRPSRSRSR